jgi:hypothetical protein
MSRLLANCSASPATSSWSDGTAAIFRTSGSPGGRGVVGRVHSLTWDEAEPVRVRRPEDDVLTLDLSIQYEIVHIPQDRHRGPYKVFTRGYMHSLQTIDGAEVIAFHWHPDGKSDDVPAGRHRWLPGVVRRGWSRARSVEARLRGLSR